MRSLIPAAEASLLRAVFAKARERAWDTAPCSARRVSFHFTHTPLVDGSWEVTQETSWKNTDDNWDGAFSPVLTKLSEADAERLADALNAMREPATTLMAAE
jgi:hypothetical protein